MIGVTKLTDEELADLLDTARAEYNRRREVSAALASMPALGIPLQVALGRSQGDEWKQPLGAFDSYPKDWTVQHGGRTWKSMVANNVWQPGEAGWHEQVEEGETPIWVQPSGAHDAYQQGDEVLFENKTWVSSVDNNTWKPGVYGWEQKDE